MKLRQTCCNGRPGAAHDSADTPAVRMTARQTGVWAATSPTACQQPDWRSTQSDVWLAMSPTVRTKRSPEDEEGCGQMLRGATEVTLQSPL
jgi:hypothetical protein